MRRAVSPGSDQAAVKAIYDRAAELRAIGLNVQVDHVLALANNGKHEASNLQILFTSMNAKKGDKLGYDYLAFYLELTFAA